CHRRLACEPGGCSAPVAGYSACLTSFTSSIRFSLHAYRHRAGSSLANIWRLWAKQDERDLYGEV
ncbi:hypothetical protein, partial [Escherichia coli]|uniref:hypothetical protein n=1 Tax=Escherichia coli TaxID=562 RepID=UPI001EFA5CAD